MNILRSIVVNSFFVLMISCQSGKSELSDEKLAKIIADMHISELALERYNESFQDSLSEVFIEKLSVIHDVPKETIKKEVELLMQDRTRQSEVYTLVIDILQDIEKESKQDNMQIPPKQN
ncbi:DUF4296 domain-containing protein [Portibacter marinus]|uniref:DUF4296 domain-containing protein n=1 Tax=Portibacter marinus TaxID=2898660 RepID=UPI001F404B28|nr:DUF4296 domain-containing protein [Portibacter marinus]